MKRCLALVAIAATAAIAWPQDATAGGYDTPILYSAKHMGMGGASQAYVDDPSAMFHNPAGLGHTPFAEALIDASLIIGNISASPTAAQQSIDAETAYAPPFLVGGAIRATDWLVFGLAFYPVAAAGAKYEYTSPTGAAQVDSTDLTFLELSPGFAVNLPYGIKLGFGYRISFVTLERVQDSGGIDFKATGTNFEGIRAGVQVDIIPELKFGASYRHKTSTEVVADTGKALSFDAEDITTTLNLPSMLSIGARTDIADFSAVLDFQWGFQSQNDRVAFTGTGYLATDTDRANPIPVELDQIFEWQDAITLRTGVEYRFPLAFATIAARLGYIWDQKTYQEAYPSAFGTPPADTHTGTAGVGFDAGAWELNLAYAFRTGSATVADDDIPTMPAEDVCRLCGASGDYSLTMNAIYVDFSWKWELGDWKIGVDPWDADAEVEMESEPMDAPADDAPAEDGM